MPRTKAQENRKIRQDRLREQLAGQKHIEQVIKNIKEIEGLDFHAAGGDGQIDYKRAQANKFRMDALKIACEQRMKLVDKYLPNLKSVELTGEGGGAITFEEWVKHLNEDC